MTSAGHYQGAGLPTLRFLFVEGEQTRAAALKSVQYVEDRHGRGGRAGGRERRKGRGARRR